MKHTQPLLLKLLTGRTASTANIPLDKKLVFILSTGRTATTYLANLLSRHENVFAVHEPRPSWRLRMYTMAYLENKVSPDILWPVFKKYRQELIASRPEPTYIESNPFLSGFATTISKNLPNSYILHIVRDPRDYITSGINHGALHGKKRLLNSYLPYWQTGSSFKRRVDLKHDMIERLALFWKLVNLEIESSREYTTNYHHIKFEDLFGDNSDKFAKEALHFIGVNEDINAKKESKGIEKNISKYRDLEKWTEWSPDIAKTVNNLCSPLMRNYGYGNEPAWQKKIK